MSNQHLYRESALSNGNNLTTIGELMTEKLETVKRFSSAQEAAIIMRDRMVSSLVVTDDNSKPLGIITPSDFAYYLKQN